MSGADSDRGSSLLVVTPDDRFYCSLLYLATSRGWKTQWARTVCRSLDILRLRTVNVVVLDWFRGGMDWRSAMGALSDPEQLMRTLRFACQSSRRDALTSGKHIATEGAIHHMNSSRRRWEQGLKGCALAAAGLFWAVATVRAAESPEPRLVDLNVVAVDSRGQPVNDLTAGDFEITDAGKQRPLAFFRHSSDRLKQQPAPAPGEFSNRGNTAAPHATLILFDLLNQRFSTRGVAANQIVRELSGMEATDGLFLYMLTVDGHLYPVRGLAGAEGEPDGQGAAPWTGRIKPLMDAAMRAVTRLRPVDIDVNIRVLMTLDLLDQVAAQLAVMPGRKNIVWITDGIPIGLGPQRSDTGEAIDFTPQLRLLSEQFDRSGVALYPVRQVMLGSPDAMGTGSGAGSEDTLDELAGLTGGRPTGSKDIGPAVRQAMSDLRTSYQIGYYTPDESWDGKFHKLRVVCRRKGVRVQAKTGYYAWAEPAGAKAQRAMAAAVAARDDAAEIGLRAVLAREPGKPGRISVRIDANDLALAQVGQRYSGQLRIALAGYMKDGSVSTSAIDRLDLDLSAADRDKALGEGIAFNQDFVLDNNLSKIRVIVFDRGSNAVGSVSVPVAVPGQRSLKEN